ncbi:MAG: hypothetical protein LBL00_03235 [Endomicrobium sp.]|jgi:hypothetical protein|nr:hypothetical protein [Endomicrobium sp.]
MDIEPRSVLAQVQLERQRRNPPSAKGAATPFKKVGINGNDKIDSGFCRNRHMKKWEFPKLWKKGKLQQMAMAT